MGAKFEACPIGKVQETEKHLNLIAQHTAPNLDRQHSLVTNQGDSSIASILVGLVSTSVNLLRKPSREVHRDFSYSSLSLIFFLPSFTLPNRHTSTMAPRVSIRISLRWLPDVASEPTDTVVFGVGSYYLDLRVLKSDNSIDWALAGERQVLSTDPSKLLYPSSSSVLNANAQC